jgi:uncharacterized membrane protein
MTAMSETRNRLVALMFDDPYRADEARAALRRLGGEGVLEIGETALIEKRADGKVRVSQEWIPSPKTRRLDISPVW